MAEYTGTDWHSVAMSARINVSPALGLLVSGVLWSPYALGYPPPSALNYKMRGQDAVTDGLYDAWVVVGEPDLDASEYAGELARPLRDVTVIDSWPQ